MNITKKDVEHIALLSRLKLTEEEKETFVKQLSGILTHVEKLNEVNTNGIEPTSHVVKMHNVMRDDAVTVSLPVEKVLANAPDSTEEFFRVPKIIE